MLKGGICFTFDRKNFTLDVFSSPDSVQEREDLHFPNLAINSSLVLPFPISHVPACFTGLIS